MVSGHQMDRSACSLNVGYVPMTSSHIAYHPYSNAASMYYKQQSTAFSPVSPAHSSITSRSPPLTSHSNHITDQSAYWPEYSYMSSPAMSAAAQRFLSDHTGVAAYTMQAYAQQAALASSLHY
ncbi:hypothetical protein DPMN_103431 [Dreissena polymorpha]|uniref:Uncharacterized protein n=2 Tax=Dreissena polymorpha TaxID=45954 RepID=A0A9D4HEB0_DREPO|nr:hypothetical protein DPMN_103431 [Dreissena polymorpha]